MEVRLLWRIANAALVDPYVTSPAKFSIRFAVRLRPIALHSTLHSCGSPVIVLNVQLKCVLPNSRTCRPQKYLSSLPLSSPQITNEFFFLLHFWTRLRGTQLPVSSYDCISSTTTAGFCDSLAAL